MMKLGKLAPKEHPNTLRLSLFFKDDLPEPARKVFREYKTPPEAIKMYLNDKYSCCVFAGLCNKIIHDTVHTANVAIPTDEEMLAAYSAVTGFDPATGAHDDGTIMVEALEYMRTVGIAGHKILAWAQIDHRNLKHRKLACDWFGGTLIGAQMPNSAMQQFDTKQSFHVIWGNLGMAGGHCMFRPGYGRDGEDYVTWANWEQKAAASWASHYVDEEYVLITPDWINKATQKTPGGLDLAALESAIGKLRA
jgi:hypothetical protein